jgi:hypothetical protein
MRDRYIVDTNVPIAASAVLLLPVTLIGRVRWWWRKSWIVQIWACLSPHMAACVRRTGGSVSRSPTLGSSPVYLHGWRSTAKVCAACSSPT